MPSNHLILYCPLLLLPSMFPSIRVFSNESALHIRWPKYWSFSFNISPSNEHPGLICFRMDWLDLLAVQGTLKSLLQHHSSKASIHRRSAFFIVQRSRPYMTSGKTIDLMRRTFVDKVMSLLFNMLSRLVITFLPRSKHLLISWLQSPTAVILEPPKIKSATVSRLFAMIRKNESRFKGNEPYLVTYCKWASQVALVALPASATNVRDVGSIPRPGRAPGGWHSNPLQYSCLENPMDRGARQATVHGVAESQTRLMIPGIFIQ